MYWILSNEFVNEDNDADLSGDVNLDLGGEISFDDGIPVTASIPKIILTLNSDSHMGEMTDHLSIDEVCGLVFSARLCELLHKVMVDNIQYFDFDIISPKDSKIYTNYKIANVVGLVDCVDKDKSDLTFYDSGTIEFIDKLVLDETKIPLELKIFRLLNRTTLPVVHQSVKDAILNAGITGCLFYKPEEYQV
ncbi:MAG: hypothetical protein L3J89_01835 [Gammaproteobacteria bacterium]|nr:hypothetical protein [Gammaproteobacteria bacterium]